MEILVSVLIPVYNTEKYVKGCVVSVQNQTLKEIEILCLNDGSTDGSAKILDELAVRDERVRVIHKENSGYGNTMNLGIRMARGKYIAIVESDDYIESDMLRELSSIAEKHQCDFVKSNYAFFWKDGNERIFEDVVLIPQRELYNTCLSKEEMRPLFRGYIANPTGIYRRNFLNENQIYHNETRGASYQDLGFFFQIMMKAKKGFLSDKSYYRYRQDNQNSSVASKEKVFCVCDEYQFIYCKIAEDKELFGQYLSLYQMFRFQSCLFTLKRIDSVYRKDFLERVRMDYMESKKLGELDLSCFYEEEKRTLELIMENADGYLEEFFSTQNKVKAAIKGYQTLIIYGAGARGNEVYGWLREEINSFQYAVYAVSENVKEKRYKNGLEIKSIYDLKEYTECALVIVAVTNRYKDEMLKIVKELRFQHITTLE